MEFDYGIYLLSNKFTEDYPAGKFPELLHKIGRAYTCLLIDSHCDYFICIPFRSNANHKFSYMFSSSERSYRVHSGLDYSKIAIIKDAEYINSSENAVIDQDEYNETIQNLPEIVTDALKYVDTYIKHVNGTNVLHPMEFSRMYKYSTLQYFHDIMNLPE